MLAVRAGMIALGLPLLCLAGDIQKPAILWERALDGDVYGSALAGDTVVLLTLEPRATRWTIEGHDARDGALRWRRAAPGTSLGPPVGGSIILGGRDGIRALDAASGAERWHFPRPVVETNAHDGALGGFSSPALLDGECLYAADYVPSPAKKDAVGESTASTSSAGTASSTPWIGATARPAGASVSTSAIGRRRRWSGRTD
jgi:outer membrane protein assembly factor BamB